jgi:pyruvate formate lyase activating enzyme
MPGLVASTLQSSVVDGPGHRFVVFMQGCNFDCVNCHNPQTIPLSSPRARVMDVGDVLAELAPLEPFLSGITVSGGEPTLQLAFLCQLFEAVKVTPGLARLTTFVDTNGTLAVGGWDKLAPWLDGAMVDLKAARPATHRTITGQDNAAVLDSLRHLHDLGKLYEVRLLVIPGLTDTPEELAAYAEALAAVGPGVRLKLMAFRHHGVRAKGRRLPEADAMAVGRAAARLRSLGLRNLVTTPVL